ncbi:uncharacterized protein LOC118241295 [Electrophorus electricus]|uniref:uncharacterized protein LOC118241295 n=1 Tax=Electrophorus electricus TaxID=8005 RepID=UPI0015CF84FF|nr:uncharacterized protein LOC118241295 [Electrophorus electricus]
MATQDQAHNTKSMEDGVYLDMTIRHLGAVCKMLVGAAYTQRHNKDDGGNSIYSVTQPSGMVCISVLISLFHGIGLLPVALGSPATLILVAEPGDDVTLWYQHEQTTPTYISWFKHTDSSVPVYISCQYFRNNSASSHCSFVNQSKRTVMSVNSQYTSLTITAVNPTDSGLYYCGIRRGSQISFSNATYLQVRARIETPSKGSSEEALWSSDVFFMLTAVFTGVILVLISVLLFMLKKKKQHSDETDCKVEQKNKEKNSSYAALKFSDKKIKKAGRHSEVDP